MDDDQRSTLIQEVTKLCQKLLRPSSFSNLSDEAVQPYVQYSLRILSGRSVESQTDELVIEEEVCARLRDRNREADAILFRDLKRRLRETGYFRRYPELIAFMHNVANYEQGRRMSKTGWTGSLAQLDSAGKMGQSSRPINGREGGTPPVTQDYTGIDVSKSSGISSMRSTSQRSRLSSSRSQDRLHRWLPANASLGLPRSRAPPPQTNANANANNNALDGPEPRRQRRPGSQASDDVMAPHAEHHHHHPLVPIPRSSSTTSRELSELDLLRELIYALMGIEGTVIRFDRQHQNFAVDKEIGLSVGLRRLSGRVAECGWLHRKLRQYLDAKRCESTFGTVGQSFCAALHQHLTEYYRLIATIEAQLIQEEDAADQIIGDACNLTLKRLSLWTQEPLNELRILAALVDVCRGKKGGALASEVHSYLANGDPGVRAAVHHILAQLAQPLYTTIASWLFEGQLEDHFQEFFVASNPTVGEDRLWHEKYNLRKSMIPAFITPEQARKILLTGKSINFLRQVCHERANLRDRENIRTAILTRADSMFNQDLDPTFEKMVNRVYKETSQYLLEVLYTKYQFLEHLKAMRRYLLLGQGDFIRWLMDLLKKDLAKPATELYLHNLSGILETAIRATNAQYDQADILQRLDVRMLEVSPGDTGWDVFSLDYHVDGPLITVFTPDSVTMYLRAFNFLWRAKRMEFVLGASWKRLLSNTRLLARIPELCHLLHLCQLLGSEMNHFVQQVQYYINFEVLECSWVELLEKVQRAEDLDQVILAHQSFLSSIITRCLLDEDSREILTQLRAIFDLIISYEELQGNMFETATEEIGFRRLYDQDLRAETNRAGWGTNQAKELTEKQRKGAFSEKSISNFQTKFKVLSQTYRDMVNAFLGKLACHPDQSLRFLSVRINFNGHYQPDKDAAPNTLQSTVTLRSQPASSKGQRSRSGTKHT